MVIGQTSDDLKRSTSVALAVSALESFAEQNGSFVVEGAGYSNGGQGWFHLNGGLYTNSIANTLVELGHLPSPPPKDPLHTVPGSFSPFDFLVYRCRDRIAVFSKADNITPDPDHQSWWQSNNCTQFPTNNHDHTYFALSQPLTGIASNTNADPERITSVALAVSALESFAEQNGSFVVEGAGYSNGGQGWFHLNGGLYTNSIANTLVELGHLPSPPPKDPLHTVPGSFSPFDFLVYRCRDRIAVFSKADNITPDPDHQSWWQSNNCTQFPINNHDHTYFALSQPLDDIASDTNSDSTPDLNNYDLIFNDEFTGTTLNSEKWDTGLLWGPYFPINNEEQLYVDTLGMNSDFSHSPFELTGSTLKITATPTSSTLQPPPRPDRDDFVQPRSYSEYRYNGPDEEAPGPGYQASDVNYLSGVITSYESLKMTHGYVEMRAKLPAGAGLWPAFWLYTTHFIEDVPEIDIMEFLGQDVDRIYHTYHYFDIEDNWRLISTPSYTTLATDWTEDFHTFGMAWSPTEIIYYVNGEETRRITDQDSVIPNQSMYIIANLAVGGNWPESPTEDPNFPAQFPATFEIDYIRAYKRKLNETLDLDNDYQLMFYDEFAGTTLDDTKWNTHFLWGPYHTINAEEQYYVDALGSDAENTTLSNTPFVMNNGILSITARQADDPNSFRIPEKLPDLNDPIWTDYDEFQRDLSYDPENINFTSGIITSYDAFKFAHGYAEMRAKVPAGNGLWPAFWLLNGYYVNIQPEIDVMEMRGRLPTEVTHNYHRLVNGVMSDKRVVNGVPTEEPVGARINTPSTNYSQDFYQYGVRWQPGRIDWYIDRQLVHTYEGEDVGYQVMYLLANLAVGGNFDDGVNVDVSRFNEADPVSLDIDYIRVYQEKHKE